MVVSAPIDPASPASSPLLRAEGSVPAGNAFDALFAAFEAAGNGDIAEPGHAAKGGAPDDDAVAPGDAAALVAAAVASAQTVPLATPMTAQHPVSVSAERGTGASAPVVIAKVADRTPLVATGDAEPAPGGADTSSPAPKATVERSVPVSSATPSAAATPTDDWAVPPAIVRPPQASATMPVPPVAEPPLVAPEATAAEAGTDGAPAPLRRHGEEATPLAPARSSEFAAGTRAPVHERPLAGGGQGRRESEGPAPATPGRAESAAPSPLPPPGPRAEASEARSTPARTAAPAYDPEHLARAGELASAPRDGGALRLEVAHDTLGRIELRIAVHDDAVHASLWASHDHAREALAAHRPALEAALGRSHLRLEGFDVGLGQHQRGQSENAREPQPVILPPPAAPARAPRSRETIALAGGLSVHA